MLRKYGLMVLLAAGICSSLFAASVPAMIASPLISKGKTVKFSSGASGNPASLVDGVFGGGAFTVTAGSFFAIDLGNGPQKIFFVWNNPTQSWSDVIASDKSCKKGIQCPTDYVIETSADSKDGTDGTWKNAVTVTGNVVTNRGHEVAFEGQRWVRMKIAKGGGTLDEAEVFDATKGLNDTWCFIGTSISDGAFKATVVQNNFAKLISAKYPGFYPAMVRAAIPCILTTQLANDISKYLQAAGNCKFWAIEMGTNDAWGGSNGNVASFKANLQKVIDSCKAHGISPVIARVLGTDPAKGDKWQVHADFIKAVDDLTTKNNLIEGPDLFAAAKANPGYLGSDGVHLSAEGCTNLHKLWADKVGKIYETVGVKNPVSLVNTPAKSGYLTMLASHDESIRFDVTSAGTVSLFSLDGTLLNSCDITKAGEYRISQVKGGAVIRFSSKAGTVNKLFIGQ